MRLTLTRLAKFSSNLKELRLHLSLTDKTSKGARDFVEKLYPTLKKDNPKVPILIRECEGVQPRLWARYSMGKETSIPLTNCTAEDVNKHVDSLGKC